jgi:NADH-quinone oxidoreductase subunit N
MTGWRADAFSVFCRALIAGGGAMLVLLSIPFTRRMDRGHGEFYALLLFALLGCMLVSGVSDLLSLFVCLELVTIMAYILVAVRRNDLRSTEAGLKYLVIGAVSTAILMLGIALIYGASKSLSFDVISSVVASGQGGSLMIVGTAMVLVGLFFKVGGVPFQVWIPDVYEGAPSPVTAFLISASKFAGVVLLLRFGAAVILPGLGTDGAFPWVALIGAAAIVTLLFGVLGAIPQRSLKRLLAYSSIGHAGYLLIGLAAFATPGGAESAAAALLYYMMAYFATSVTAFGVIVVVSGASSGDHRNAFRGLSTRSPFLALAMALALFSLAGVPPMSGFFGKFLILYAAVGSDLYVLAFIGALAVIVSLYFYMLWIKEMYIKPADETSKPDHIPVTPLVRTVLWIGMAAMLLMGLYMGPFYGWVSKAASAFASVGG